METSRTAFIEKLTFKKFMIFWCKFRRERDTNSLLLFTAAPGLEWKAIVITTYTILAFESVTFFLSLFARVLFYLVTRSCWSCWGESKKKKIKSAHCDFSLFSFGEQERKTSLKINLFQRFEIMNGEFYKFKIYC